MKSSHADMNQGKDLDMRPDRNSAEKDRQKSNRSGLGQGANQQSERQSGMNEQGGMGAETDPRPGMGRQGKAQSGADTGNRQSQGPGDRQGDQPAGSQRQPQRDAGNSQSGPKKSDTHERSDLHPSSARDGNKQQRAEAGRDNQKDANDQPSGGGARPDKAR